MIQLARAVSRFTISTSKYELYSTAPLTYSLATQASPPTYGLHTIQVAPMMNDMFQGRKFDEVKQMASTLVSIMRSAVVAREERPRDCTRWLASALNNGVARGAATGAPSRMETQHPSPDPYPLQQRVRVHIT